MPPFRVFGVREKQPVHGRVALRGAWKGEMVRQRKPYKGGKANLRPVMVQPPIALLETIHTNNPQRNANKVSWHCELVSNCRWQATVVAELSCMRKSEGHI